MVHNNECMDYSADGRLLVTGAFDGLVKLWDAETGKLMRAFSGHSGGVVGVHFTPDQRRLISQSRDGTVRLWDPATGKELLSLTDPLFAGMWTWYVAVSRDGRRVFAAPGHRKDMIIWEGATPGQVAAWQRERAADAALWAAEQTKIEARQSERAESEKQRRTATQTLRPTDPL
jgi:WD40 repeat protein